MIETFWSFIIIGLLQQNMTSSFPSGGTPEKLFPVRYNLSIQFSILLFWHWYFLHDLDESLFDHTKQKSEDAIANKKIDKKKGLKKEQNLL